LEKKAGLGYEDVVDDALVRISPQGELVIAKDQASLTA
jgi:hypothetical protein